MVVVRAAGAARVVPAPWLKLMGHHRGVCCPCLSLDSQHVCSHERHLSRDQVPGRCCCGFKNILFKLLQGK